MVMYGKPAGSFSFDCAHCGKRLSGDYLPRKCLSCGKDHTHRIGLERLIFSGKRTFKPCTTPSCTKLVDVKDFPKLTTAQASEYWIERDVVTGKGKDREKQGKRKRKKR